MQRGDRTGTVALLAFAPYLLVKARPAPGGGEQEVFTAEACRRFNDLIEEGQKVAAALHPAC